jgi:hypothetical protein
MQAQIGATGDICPRSGVSTCISGQHQHLTAAPEHTSMWFEESRLQYHKYNFNKQKGCFTLYLNAVLFMF